MENRKKNECQIGQNVHRNISNVTGNLWGQSTMSHLRQSSVWKSSEEQILKKVAKIKSENHHFLRFSWDYPYGYNE